MKNRCGKDYKFGSGMFDLWTTEEIPQILMHIMHQSLKLRQSFIKVLDTYITKNLKNKNKITSVKIQILVMHIFKFSIAHLILATAHNFRPCNAHFYHLITNLMSIPSYLSQIFGLNDTVTKTHWLKILLCCGLRDIKISTNNMPQKLHMLLVTMTFVTRERAVDRPKSIFLRIPKRLPAIGKPVSIAGRCMRMRRIGAFSRWTDYSIVYQMRILICNTSTRIPGSCGEPKEQQQQIYHSCGDLSTFTTLSHFCINYIYLNISLI
ncbi:hypothetical protein AGLY_009029 [Aphis glycines]|uniref:Uncharacterized protein n=1 Tax=Aphis glycines TaxID=307491 RepID=A0A6G0TJ84_APHGL|nr:hypothetical protein AGLY_009029 [Aphis glycines]